MRSERERERERERDFVYIDTSNDVVLSMQKPHMVLYNLISCLISPLSAAFPITILLISHLVTALQLFSADYTTIDVVEPLSGPRLDRPDHALFQCRWLNKFPPN